MTSYARYGFYLLWMVVFLSSLYAESAQPTKLPSIQDVLAESHAEERALAEGEAAFHLSLLVSAAARVNDRHTEEWVNECLSRAAALPGDWNRLAIQKNALVALAAVNPRRATQLIMSLDRPIPLGDGRVPEDVRADAARRIFLAYWQVDGRASIPIIRQTARYLGDTGEYPYVAMSPIIKDVAGIDTGLANDLFLEALDSYRHTHKVESADHDFLSFLTSCRAVLPSGIILRGARSAATRLSSELNNPPVLSHSVAYMAGTTVGNERLLFDRPSLVVLLTLMPLVQDLDPPLAQRLCNTWPILASANKRMADSAVIESGYITEINDPESIEGLKKSMIERSRRDHIVDLSATNPDAARSLAASMQDKELRSAALAAVSAAYAQRDFQAAANRAFDAARVSRLQDNDEDDDLPTLVYCVKAAAARLDKRAVREALIEGISIGERVVARDLEVFPGKPLPFATGFDSLMSLICLGVTQCPDVVLPRVSAFGDPALKAYMLIAVADGLNPKGPVLFR